MHFANSDQGNGREAASDIYPNVRRRLLDGTGYETQSKREGRFLIAVTSACGCVLLVCAR